MKKQCSYHFIWSALLPFFLPLSVCRESFCSFTADAKRLKRLLACDVYSTMKYTQLFMNAIGLILSDIKWASQREEWLFYSLSLLVKDVKLTFTVWAETLAWCSVALDWHLILMHPVVRAAISVCFKGRGWERAQTRSVHGPFSRSLLSCLCF